MPRQLSDRARQLLEDIPPWMHEDPDIQGAMQVMSSELDRLDTTVQEVLNTYFPQFAVQYLPLWEAILGLAPLGTIPQRQQRALAHVFQRYDKVPGRSWVQNVTALVGPGFSWTRDSATSTITITFFGDPDTADELMAFLRAITPANTRLVIDFGQGFLVQSSQIQQQPL